MSDSFPPCIEMPLKPEWRSSGAGRGVKDDDARSAAPGELYWKAGTQLEVRFLDGDPLLQQKVASVASNWSGVAGIEFVFSNSPDAEIRITFSEIALWSFIGTDALDVPLELPTMCLGVLTPLTDYPALIEIVLHAFGHVLGFRHSTLQFTPIKDITHIFVLGASSPSVLAPLFRSPADSQLVESVYPRAPFRADGPLGIVRGGQSPGVLGTEGGTDPMRATDSKSPHPPLTAEPIRLDVAYPEEAFAKIPFDIAVAVRQLNSPPLAISDLPKYAAADGTVYRPGEEDVIHYRIEVSGVDCEVKPPVSILLLKRGTNSQPRFFQVVAYNDGQQTLIVNAYQVDEAVAAQTRVKIRVEIAIRNNQTLSRPGDVSTPDPLQGKKPELLDELSKLPVSETPLGRTSLLDGIPGTDALNRDVNNERLDLDLIVTQLAVRGRMANGELPLVKLIDNALPYAQGFEGENKLNAIKQILVQA